MSLEEFIQTIQQSKFQHLLNHYGFNLVYKNHEKNDGYHDSYLIGYESNDCKIGLYYEPGGGTNVLIGPSSITFGDNKAEWIGLEYVICFLLNRPIKRGYGYSGMNLQQQIIDGLSSISQDFELLGEKIIAMFQDNKKIKEWKPMLEQYIKDDTRRRYNLK